jgi:hypothetical protein
MSRFEMIWSEEQSEEKGTGSRETVTCTNVHLIGILKRDRKNI